MNKINKPEPEEVLIKQLHLLEVLAYFQEINPNINLELAYYWQELDLAGQSLVKLPLPEELEDEVLEHFPNWNDILFVLPTEEE